MKKRPFDDAYLLAYSGEHITYEIDMFFGMVEMLSPSNKIGAPSAAEKNRLNFAMIESFVVHLRNTIEFLYNEDPEPTDVVAADYSTSWQKIRPPLSPVLKNARVRANKELAHLTTDRIAGNPPAKQWAFLALAGEIRPLLHLFVRYARMGALSPSVSQVIRRIA